ncbi:hypothetical protein IAQ61_011819 [Plenodomus lingam]|uniref:uncharacterized protein n=1 Tax=Leptosphaeria maculans TaxID=5022 RepID=UPI00331D48B1|nr:hypothetical protein IAQ61_011819 [Plenodomus lingam]
MAEETMGSRGSMIPKHYLENGAQMRAPGHAAQHPEELRPTAGWSLAMNTNQGSPDDAADDDHRAHMASSFLLSEISRLSQCDCV